MIRSKYALILKENLYSEFIQDHLLYFTEDTLRRLLEWNGFEVLSCTSVWYGYVLSAEVRKRRFYDISGFREQQEKVRRSVDAFLADMNARKLTVAVWGAGHQAVRESRQVQPAQTFRPEDYTQAKFRKAYEELHIFREFVRICDLRRKLDWPREAFDGMIRTLRDNRIIRVIPANEADMTKDEIQDCFVDESNTIMGLITWYGR